MGEKIARGIRLPEVSDRPPKWECNRIPGQKRNPLSIERLRMSRGIMNRRSGLASDTPPEADSVSCHFAIQHLNRTACPFPWERPGPTPLQGHAVRMVKSHFQWRNGIRIYFTHDERTFPRVPYVVLSLNSSRVLSCTLSEFSGCAGETKRDES